MGNDGGDIPRRKELVKDRTKVQTADPKLVARGRSHFCNLTKQPLTLPLAICRLGFIYNYESLLQGLVSKTLPSKYEYTKKKNDIKKIQVSMCEHDGENLIVCPITNMPYNGLNKFVALWTCGHVLSVKALKEIKGERKCLVCEEPYTEEDKIDLNLTQQQQSKLKHAIISKRKKNKIHEGEKIVEPALQKQTKVEVPLNKLEQLDGNISALLKTRDNFKQLFHKEYVQGDNLFIRPSKIGFR